MSKHHDDAGNAMQSWRCQQGGALDAWLLRSVDVCLAGCIFIVPLLLGGAHPLGPLAVTALSAAAASAWMLRECCGRQAGWRSTPALPLLLGGVVLALLQIVPLPPQWLQRLSPGTLAALPLWSGQGDAAPRLGSWQTISLTPALTRAGLSLFLAYGMLFWVTVQRIGRLGDVERLLRWCAMAAVGLAAFGLVQFFASNGKFFWFYEHPYCNTSDGVHASFGNKNHFADFLALGIGPLLWWMQDAQRREDTHKPFLVMAVWLVLLAGLLSFSRGGMAAIVLAAAVATAAGYRASLVGRKLAAGLLAVVLLLGASLSIFGYERLCTRLEGFFSGSLEQLDQGQGRRALWAALLRAIPNYPLFGSGVGSHAEVYPIYFDAGMEAPIEYTHAENGYLQVALETGAAGSLLLAGGIGMAVVWCAGGVGRGQRAWLAQADSPDGRTSRQWHRRVLICQGAIAASLLASLAHALVDFAWYLPGCTVVVTVLAACAFRVYQLAGQSHVGRIANPSGRSASSLDGLAIRPTSAMPRPVAVAVLGALVAAGAWMIAGQAGPVAAYPHWKEYLKSQVRPESQANKGREEPSAAESAAEAEQRRLIAELEEVVRWQPDHARAHLALAEGYLRLFEMIQLQTDNPMPLASLREAAARSHFGSREALDAWIARATGTHRALLPQAWQQVQESLRLCPLQGQGYLALADLCFCAASEGIGRKAYLEQALRVRPYDGGVLYAAATEAWLAGDVPAWQAYLRRAFHGERRYEETMVRDLLSRGSAKAVPAMLAFLVCEFQPDLAILRLMHDEAMKRVGPEPLAVYRRYYADALAAHAESLQGDAASQAWLEARGMYRGLKLGRQAAACAGRAVQCDPSGFEAHYQLAQECLEQGQFAEAESNFRWCAQRRPDRKDVDQKQRQALKACLYH
jgi:O-antigen ligase